MTPRRIFPIYLILLSLAQTLSPALVFAGTAALPQSNVNIAMPDTHGYTIETVCAQGCQFSTLHEAVNAAACGTVITLKAGETFTEDSYVLPSKPCDENHWIMIESSALNQLPPPGVRVAPQYAPFMPIIQSGNSDSILSNYGRTGDINHYRLMGLNFLFSSNDHHSTFALYLGNGQPTDTSTRIIIDRCMIQGQAAYSNKEGLIFAASQSAVVDSYISEIHGLDNVWADANAIIVPGHGEAGYLFQNNFLEGSGENMGFGGGGIGNVYDITITHNYFYKNPAWNVNSPSYGGVRWIVKNLLEFKVGVRVLIDGNIFQNTWSDAQSSALVLTPRSSQNVGALVDDVTIRNNIVQHAPSVINSSSWDGYDTHWNYQTMGVELHRVELANNIFDDIGGVNVCCGASPIVFTTYGGPPDVHIYHNTMVSTGDYAANLGSHTMPPVGTGFQFNDNIVFGDGLGTVALNDAFSDWTFNNNGVVGTSYGTVFPPTTVLLTDGPSIGFVNYNSGNGGDYHLTPGSPLYHGASDGTDVGANIDTVLAATAGVFSGNDPHHAPFISHIVFHAGGPAAGTITWTTDEPADSQVTYGVTTAYGASSPLAERSGVINHSVALSNLTLGTTYHFIVQSSDFSGHLAVSSDQTFMTSGTNPSTSVLPLANVKIYPNPWRSDKHGNQPVTFTGLTVGSDIKIFTLSGHKIKEIHSADISVLWDLTNTAGEKVASGIYSYLLTDNRGNKVRGKLAVIR